MGFFKRSKPPDDPPETVIAAKLCGVSIAATQALLEKAKLSWADAAAWDLFSEYVCVFLHVADRVAFNVLPQPKRAKFIDLLFPLTAGLAVHFFSTAASREVAPGGFDRLLERTATRQEEYGALQSIGPPPGAFSATPDSIVGRFLSTIPEPWRAKFAQDPMVRLEETLNFASSITAMDLNNQIQRFGLIA